jgi:PAS domain S-box-containing protein
MEDTMTDKLAPEKLQLSERRLAEAQQVAHIGSWERDLRTNEIIWSDELYRLFGLPVNQGSITYGQIMNHILPQDVDRLRAVVDEALRERKSFNSDYRIVLPDGRVQVLNARGNVILDETGEPIRIIGTAQNVTELRQAERAQQELERQKLIFQTIFDNIPVMINFIDADGRVQMINREWERVLGLSLEEARSRDLLPEIYPDPEYRARAMEYILHPTPGWKDFRILLRDGRTIDTSWALSVLPDGTRIGFGRDITERKQAEQERKQVEMALRQSEERINLAVRAADLGIFEHDHQTDTLYWSPMMRTIMGSGKEEAASMKLFFERVHPEDRERIAAAIHQAHAPGGDGLYKVEHRLVRPDGGIRWVNVWSRTLFEGEENARCPLRTVGIVADVTDRKGAEQKIREYSESVQALSRRLLEVQEEERRHLARELHDEFGQVLFASTLYLQAAQGLAGEASRPGLDKCATLLRQALEQVHGLALELRPPMLDTLGLEVTLGWLAEQHHQQTGCEVQVVGHLSGEPPSPELAIVCFRMAQEALTNVARHASAQHVWIELNGSERALELAIRDDGVGFDVAASREQAARHGRLGLLGMAERVRLLGGTLQVESEPGRGTRIGASFPLSQAEETQ